MHTLAITGVSGALGSRLLPLVSDNPKIGRIIGIDSAPLARSAPKLEFARVDLAQADLVELLTGVDTLVHLVPPNDFGLLRSIFDAASKVGVTQVVVISSVAVYGAWPGNAVPLAEDAPLRPNPGFVYATRLGELERMADQWRRVQPGVAVTVLRLAMVLGGGYEQALAIVLGGVQSHRQAHITRPVQFLHIDDAVRAIALAVDRGLDGVYNVSPNGFLGDQTAREVAGAPPRPAMPGRLAFVANDWLWRRRYRGDFRAAQPYLEHPWVMASDRLQAAGWNPLYTSEEALVAEATPTWWGSLRPGQRRAIVTGGLVGGSVMSSVTPLLVAALKLRRSRRGRSVWRGLRVWRS